MSSSIARQCCCPKEAEFVLELHRFEKISSAAPQIAAVVVVRFVGCGSDDLRIKSCFDHLTHPVQLAMKKPACNKKSTTNVGLLTICLLCRHVPAQS
jgi:hypothetical protein